ncbi:hypothetical protein H2203_008814 [Taxawa tesnikishii (nom. ined.)]|nr:hypothetical protein H2203_008814 [Dothideales sp. JES 119]
MRYYPAKQGELPDYYDFEKYLLKPKIKHGPRPIAVSERPALSSAGSFGRPTSALPAGVHIKPKQADATPINTEEPAPAASPSLFEFSPLPPPPPIPVAVDLEAARPSSRGSSRSMRSAKTSGSNVTSKSAMTPEKLRLMKAAEMRRRHLKRAQATEQHPTPSPSQEVLGSPKLPRSGAKTNLQNQEQWEPDTLPNVPESNALPNKVDSGIQISDHQSPKSAHASPDLPAKLDEPEEPAVPLMQLAAHKETRETEDVMNDSAHDQIEDARLSIVTGTSGNEFSKPGDLAFVDSPTLGKLVEPTIPEQANMPMSPLPTIVMGDGSRPRCSSQDRAVDQQPPVTATEPQALPPDLQESETFPGMTIRQSQKSADLRKKRRGFIEPLSINTERTDADDIFSSDDELMEELQSATVQEAKFISVSKSPATPFFPRRPSSNSVYSIKSAKSGASVDPMIPRTNSSPLTLMEKLAAATDRLSPGALSSQSRSRSSSSGRTPASEKADPMAIARKGQVSSKISDRIRALAEKSVRETSPPPVATTESIPSGIFAMRKASVRDTSDLQPQPSAPKTGRPMASFTKVAPWPVQATRPTPAPSENQTVYTVQQDPTSKRDSVSVTARIVRRPSTQTGHPSTGEAAPLELQQSPLIINHKRGAASQSNIQPLAPLITDSAALRTKSNAGSTLTDDVLSPVSDAMSPTQSRASMDSHRTSWRKSFGRNKENKNPASASRALSPSSILSDESTSSRTSRFLRRISAIASPKKRDPSPPHSPRSVMPPNAAAYMPSISSVTSQTQPPNASTSITLPAVHIGDLNVQFPDNLVRQTLVDSYGGTRLRDARVLTTWQLWRRRCLDIDADGHLVFSPAKGNDYKKSVVQRFSLREFKEVYVPEIERQELPNSEFRLEEEKRRKEGGGVLTG